MRGAGYTRVYVNKLCDTFCEFTLLSFPSVKNSSSPRLNSTRIRIKLLTKARSRSPTSYTSHLIVTRRNWRPSNPRPRMWPRLLLTRGWRRHLLRNDYRIRNPVPLLRRPLWPTFISLVRYGQYWLYTSAHILLLVLSFCVHFSQSSDPGSGYLRVSWSDIRNLSTVICLTVTLTQK